MAMDEEDIVPLLPAGGIIIADPMYKPVCPEDCDFRALPSEAFSGRIYRKEILNFINSEIKI